MKNHKVLIIILIGFGVISSGIIISDTQFSYAQLHTCDAPFVDVFVPPSWLDEIRICFEDQDKIFELGQNVTIHMYAETTQPVEWIRIHFFHSSQVGYFEINGTERQFVKESRINESPHLINLQDNERIFGTDLEDATHFTINCNDLPCQKPYEQERIFQFSFPGIYYYEITMQTPNATKIYSHYPGIEIFRVLTLTEKLEMDANQLLISQPSHAPNLQESESDNFDLTPLYIFGAFASIVALILVLIQHFSKYDFKPIFRNIFSSLKTFSSLPILAYQNAKQVSIKSKKVLGKNFQYPALLDVELKLNKKPDSIWVNFFRNPGTWNLAVGKLGVVGNKINIRCEESRIDTCVEWAHNYVEQGNKQYSKYLKEQDKERLQKEKRDKEDKEKLKRIQDKLDDK